MNIKVVCFDLGGVLLHVTFKWSEAARVAGVTTNVAEHLTLDEFPSFPLFQAGRLPMQDYVNQLAAFLEVTPSDAKKIHNQILLQPTEGTYEIISQLKAKGIATGCLSNTNGPHWEELLSDQRFPNIGLLDFKVASQEVGHNKPDREIYHHFETVAGVLPNEILFFDDLLANIKGAEACGWHACQIDPNQSQAPQIRSILIQFGLV